MAAPSKSSPRYPTTIGPTLTLPFTKMSSGMYTVSTVVSSIMPNADRNLPSTMSRSRIGAVFSSVSVPVCRSSARSRMLSTMLATIVAPLAP